MRIEQIRSFISVYETGSFTAAADKLYTRQPVITKHIVQLERELGCPLFTRTTRKVAPTRAGDAFYEKAREALLLLDRGIAEVKALEETMRTSLHVGYVYLYMDSLTTAWSREFAQANPDAHISISEASFEKVIEGLTDGSLDCAFLGVTSENLIPAYLGRTLILQMGEIIVVGKTHRLAGRGHVTAEDLLTENFVYPTQKPTSVNSIVMKDFEDRRRTLHSTVVQFESSAMKLVEIGAGIIDLPAKSPVNTEHVACIPYDSDCVISYYFVWNRGNEKPLFTRFRDYISTEAETAALVPRGNPLP